MGLAGKYTSGELSTEIYLYERNRHKTELALILHSNSLSITVSKKQENPDYKYLFTIY